MATATGTPAQARLFRQQTVSTDVLALARERIAHTFDLFDHVSVSFSGGKDSTVCLELALEEAERRGRLPLDVIFCDEEAIPYETEAYVRRRAADARLAVRWYCLPVKHRNACTRADPYWWPWAPEARDLWVRPLPPEGLRTLAGFPVELPAARLSWPDTVGLLFPPRAYGRVGMLLGIRAQESMTRRRNVLARQIDNYLIPYDGATSCGNVTQVKPIYDWQTEDVWSAPRHCGWDYNAAYRALDMAGVPTAQQRCSPPYGEEPLAKLWTYQVCFPDVWEKMALRVPGAATAARYASGTLYSFNTPAAKPAHLSWEQHIAELLARHAPGAQRTIAARVAEEIAKHYRKTSDPIVAHSPHPASGVSWAWLARVASRGDFKERQRAIDQMRRRPHAETLARYRAELAGSYAQEAGGTHGASHGAPLPTG